MLWAPLTGQALGDNDPGAILEIGYRYSSPQLPLWFSLLLAMPSSFQQQPRFRATCTGTFPTHTDAAFTPQGGVRVRAETATRQQAVPHSWPFHLFKISEALPDTFFHIHTTLFLSLKPKPHQQSTLPPRPTLFSIIHLPSVAKEPS